MDQVVIGVLENGESGRMEIEASLTAIEKWDDRLPKVTSQAVPFVDVKNLEETGMKMAPRSGSNSVYRYVFPGPSDFLPSRPVVCKRRPDRIKGDRPEIYLARPHDLALPHLVGRHERLSDPRCLTDEHCIGREIDNPVVCIAIRIGGEIRRDPRFCAHFFSYLPEERRFE